MAVLAVIGGLMYVGMKHSYIQASSHREAPLISNDPEADNTDVYAFRDPSDTNYIDIIAAYVPAELPHGGPNYYSFGEDVAYDIHVKNNAATSGDDITYRFTFGPWNISTGADPFGPPARKEIAFATKIREYKKLGFDGVQFHDDDVVEADLDPQSTERGAAKVKKMLESEGLNADGYLIKPIDLGAFVRAVVALDRFWIELVSAAAETSNVTFETLLFCVELDGLCCATGSTNSRTR